MNYNVFTVKLKSICGEFCRRIRNCFRRHIFFGDLFSLEICLLMGGSLQILWTLSVLGGFQSHNRRADVETY